MATDVVLPLESRVQEWHETEPNAPRRQTPADSSSRLPGLMAQPPTGDSLPQQPSLPSFRSFLAAANNSRHFDQPRRGDVRRNTFTSSEGHSSTSAMTQPSHAQADTVNRPSWSYSATSRSESQPPAPGPHAARPPVDHAPGRASVEEDPVDESGSCPTNEDDTICSKNPESDGHHSTWNSIKSSKLKMRSGQTCDACREKKMRCDFKFPKCTMCKNINRDCTFGSAPRATMRNSAYPMSMPSTPKFTNFSQGKDHHPPRRGSTTSIDMASKERFHPQSMPVDNMLYPASEKQANHEDRSENRPPAKRLRVSPSPRPRSQGQMSASSGTESVGGSVSSPSAISNFSWDADPYDLSRSLTLDYADTYFQHVDGVTYHILPKDLFRHWIRHCHTKSLTDKMLLYAILAMGTVFAPSQPYSKHHQDVFLEIVNKAIIKNGDMFSLQLIQTKLILALIAFSQGQYNRASDHCGSAVRTAFGLRYHTEEGVSTIAGQDALDFGLSRQMLVECRRRTFWAAYLMDSFSCCWSASVTTVNRSDCHLRLPCAEAAYEAGHVPLAPFVLELSKNNEESQPAAPQESSEVGSFGFLVEIAGIFSEVMSIASRGKTQSPAKDRLTTDVFRQDVQSRLKTWDYFMRKHIRQGRDGRDGRDRVGGFHILYHYTAMILNRYIPYLEMDQLRISVCATQVHEHARSTLELVQRLREHGDSKHDSSFEFAMLSPFSGFAITAALDVVTSAGLVASLMGHESHTMSWMGSVFPVLETLKVYWHSARQQQEMVDQRLRALLEVSKKASEFNGAYYFSRPMQSRIDLDHDVTYGLSRRRYFEVMGWDDHIDIDGEFQRLD